jgi:hypothetical protein
MEMGEIAGVSAQRQGQVSNRETVGGVERSVNQSSHITEWWFMLHEQCKIRVLETFLETAKIALKGNNKKVQFLLDDQSIQVLNLEDNDFSEQDYGIVITTSGKTMELEQMIKQNAQAFLQNGGSMSTIMDIYFSSSLMDMRRKLEDAEEQMHQRQSEQAQESNKIQQQHNQATVDLENRKLELEDMKNQRDNQTKYDIALLSQEANVGDLNGDGVEDPMEREKFNLSVEQKRQDYILKMKQLNNDMLKHKDNVELTKEAHAISRTKKATK